MNKLVNKIFTLKLIQIEFFFSYYPYYSNPSEV